VANLVPAARSTAGGPAAGQVAPHSGPSPQQRYFEQLSRDRRDDDSFLLYPGAVPPSRPQPPDQMSRRRAMPTASIPSPQIGRQRFRMKVGRPARQWPLGSIRYAPRV
jgi:hypothetical protein